MRLHGSCIAPPKAVTSGQNIEIKETNCHAGKIKIKFLSTEFPGAGLDSTANTMRGSFFTFYPKLDRLRSCMGTGRINDVE